MPAPRRDPPLASTLLSDSNKPLPALFPTPTPELALLHDKLYNLVALILRAYVREWYMRISPRDDTLLPTINNLLVLTLSPVLEIDLPRLNDLILVDLPVLLTTHVRTYWESRGAVNINPGALDHAYHARLPLVTVALQTSSVPVEVPTALAEALSQPLTFKPPAAEETYALSPVYLTALSDALLSLQLPPEDYASDAERLIVREVLARAVLENIGKRLSAPWFWVQLGIKLIPPKRQRPRRTLWGSIAHMYTVLLSCVHFIWAAGVFIVQEMRQATTPKHKHVAGPWLALVRAILVGPGVITPTPVFIPWALLLLESVCLILTPILDRLLPRLLDHAMTPKTGIKLLDMAERVLFPNGWPTPTILPTPEEAIELDLTFRQRVRERGIPDYLVDPLSDSGCNAHLVGLVINAVAAAVIPDLASHRSLL